MAVSQTLAQFYAVLTIGAELQLEAPDWERIYRALGLTNARLDSLPFQLITADEMNVLIKPPLHIFSRGCSTKEGIPHKFAMGILERAAIFLHRAVGSCFKHLQVDQRQECFLQSFNLLMRGSVKKVDQFSDELVDCSLRILLRILDQDLLASLARFGPNMGIGLMLALGDLLDQGGRANGVRVSALLLLERGFRWLVTPEMYPRVVPGVLSLATRVLRRNPETDSSKVLVQALASTRAILSQTAGAVSSREQGGWGKDFHRGAQAVIRALDVLSNHASPLVQRKLIAIYFWALKDARLFDDVFKAKVLDVLLPLVFSAHPQTQGYGFQGLVKTVGPAALATCFNLHHAKLVHVFTAETEAEKVRLLKLLSCAVLALGPAVDGCLPNLTECWLSWCKILLPGEGSGVVEVSETWVAFKETSAESTDPAYLCSEIQRLSQGLPLKYITSKATFDILAQFFQYVGFYHRHVDTLLSEAMQILSSDTMEWYRSGALCIMDHILVGRSMATAPLLEFHGSSWNREVGDICLALLPTLVDAMDVGSGLANLHALHMVALAAVHHGPNFRLELFSVLYAVIEKVGHPTVGVSWAAKHCLKVIGLACGYSSVLELIHDNLDYVIHSVTLRLHPTNIHPPTAAMLSALFQLSKGHDLTLLDDIFDLVVDGLHASSVVGDPHTVTLFLEVFANMLVPISRGLIARERQLLSNQLDYPTSGLQAFLAERKVANQDMLPSEPQNHAILPPRPSEDATVKRCHGRLEKVLAAASCFVSHSDLRCRQLSMQVIAQVAKTSADLSISPELAMGLRQPLDPMWHRLWPGLRSQLDHPNPILVESALAAIAAIHAFSPDFLTHRVTTQIFPRVLALPPSLRLAGLEFFIATVPNLITFDPWDLFDTIHDLCHQPGFPDGLDLIQAELIPALERIGGPHADVAQMLTSTIPRLSPPETKRITP